MMHCLHLISNHCLLHVVVQVNWTISRAMSVTEGDVVKLHGAAFGEYANEVAIGVDCSQPIATDVEPGMNASMLLVELCELPHFVLLPPCVQLFLAMISTSLLEPRFTSVMLELAKASQVMN